MIVDLHTHYPMHVLAGHARFQGRPRSNPRPTPLERIRRWVLRSANRIANYPADGRRPAVTAETLAASKIRVALSALFLPFNEMDLDVQYGAPPQPHYFTDLRELLELVNRKVARDPDRVEIAGDRQAVDRIVASGRVALIHSVEGGFHLGGDEPDIASRVGALASMGVASITVAHLFWRKVATNAPAVPFLPDFIYRRLFPQPDAGLCPLGRALVHAMIDHGILIDVTHMSHAAFRDTFALLDERDPRRTIPLLATHSACRAVRKTDYNLDDGAIAGIINRDGVIGLIASSHWMAPNGRRTRDFTRTMQVLIEHIEHIEDVARRSGARQGHHYCAIGSDQDGFIKPALEGLDFPSGYSGVQSALARRFPDAWQRICSGNALRVLDAWGRRPA